MNRRTRVAAISLTFALAVPGLTACAGIAEKAAEKAAGAAIGGDVNVEDGEVTLTDESGNAVAVGENVSVPDNWPAAVPLFEGGSLIMVSVNADGTAGGMWTTDQKAADAAAAYDASLIAAGFTQTQTSNLGEMVMNTYEGNGLSVSVNAISADDGTTGVTLSVSPSTS